LTKKRKPKHPSSNTYKKSFNPEESKYFTPVSFVLIFLALVYLFKDFIFSSYMLHGSDTIQAGFFFRSCMVDYVNQFGAIPKWNPYIFGGMPYIEAFHGDIFYPLSLLKYFGSIYRMLGLVLFWHIFLSGIFMYLCARQFQLSKVASLMAGITYMFSSYLVSLVSPGHDGKIFVTTLFPLTILFLERGFTSKKFLKKFFNFSMLGMVIGIIILSPHPQMSYFSLWGIALYAAFKLIYMLYNKVSIVKVAIPASLTTYAVIIGLLLSAIQFYPGYNYTTKFSPRADSKRGWAWATSWSLHEEEAMSLLVPEFAGVHAANRDYARQTVYWGKNAFKDNSESVSVVSIFIALLGLIFSRRKEAYFFGGLGIFAFLYALGDTTPVFKLFYYLIPKVESLRAPSMIMFLFAFSIALLSAIGVQTIINKSRELSDKSLKNFRYLLFGVPGFLLLVAILFSLGGKGMIDLWSSLFYETASSKLVQKGVSKLDVGYLNLASIQIGAWFSFLFTSVASLIIWLYRNKKVGATIISLLLLLPLINDIRFNKRFIGVENQNKLWSESSLTDFFKKTDGQFRVANFVTRMVPLDFLPTFGIEVVTGYHGNQLRWYDELLGGPALRNKANPTFLNLAGAEYILINKDQQFPESYFGDKPVTVAKDFGQVKIMKNENALPRLFLTDQYKVFDSTKLIYDAILKGADDIDSVVYLEEKPSIEILPDPQSFDSVWFIDRQNDSILIGVEVTKNKLLILTENYYEAWHVYIDGVKTDLKRAYGTFRVVEVPAGSKKLLFKYHSDKYQRGKTVTWVTSIYLLLIIGGYFVMTGFRKKQIENEIDQ
jgi:hypothetical protein